MDKKLYTVSEIARLYCVSSVAVRNWLKGGLRYKKEKVVGIKTRMVIDPKDVDEYHKGKAMK